MSLVCIRTINIIPSEVELLLLGDSLLKLPMFTLSLMVETHVKPKA